MAEARLCSKCKEVPAVNGQAYCRECRNKYQKDYEAAQAEMLAGKAFQEGANALRLQLRDAFMHLPLAEVKAMDVARFIHEFPAPQRSSLPPST